MRVESNEPARFGRDSPVLRHWLANSTGFRVEGPGCHGTVERVYGLPGATTSIAVRRRLRRRVLVPAAAVAEVVPAEELLVVGRARAEGPANRRPPRRIGRRTGAAVTRGAGAFGRSSAYAAAASSRRLARAARAVGRLLALVTLLALRVLRDAALSLEEVAQASWPVARRIARWGGREVALGVARARESIERGRSRRRREKLARSLEAMVASLGRDRGSGNGHVSSESRERPRVEH